MKKEMTVLVTLHRILESLADYAEADGKRSKTGEEEQYHAGKRVAYRYAAGLVAREISGAKKSD